MSYNQNFYSNSRGNNTFHNGSGPRFYNFPPPPPPPYASKPPPLTDQEFVKSFECKLETPLLKQKELISMSSIRNQLFSVSETLNKLKSQQKQLSKNIKDLTESEWQTSMLDIKNQQEFISGTLSNFNQTHLDLLRKLVAKRSAKRLRLKRLQMKKKKEKAERFIEMKEHSRKIDENLQKIKDDILKAKQEEEAKLKADSVLRDVVRKKSDAKKCIVKVDALVKLRMARQNTATGRGETANEKDAADFMKNIEKLKSLWLHKLLQYETEEAELRAKLASSNQQEITPIVDVNKVEIATNLKKWNHFLFGGDFGPQVDFGGDVKRFIETRFQWDQYINTEGTTLPVGWVVPNQ